MGPITNKPPKVTSTSKGINLPDPMWERIEKLGGFRGRSRNNIVRLLIEISLPIEEARMEAELRQHLQQHKGDGEPDLTSTAVDLDKHPVTIRKRTPRR